jgi:hypothetical protein
MAPATNRAGVKDPVACTTNPVISGANAADKSAEIHYRAQGCGVARRRAGVGQRSRCARRAKPKNIVTDIDATAMKLLAVSAATNIASAIATTAPIVSSLRLACLQDALIAD